MRKRFRPTVIAAILVAGWALAPATAATSSGRLDPTFGGDGMVETPGAGQVAVQPNGKILASGSAGTTRHSATGEQELTFPGYLERIVGGDSSVDSDVITHHGSRYTRWNPDGTAEWETDISVVEDDDYGLWTQVGRASAIDDQGRIVAASSLVNSFMFSETVVVARFLPDGGYDPLFGVNGRLYLPRQIDGWFHRENVFEMARVAIDPEGRIVLGSHDRELDVGHPHCGVICLVRLLPNGVLDPTFGTGGLSSFGTSRSFHTLDEINFAPSGAILVRSSSGLFRLTADGQLVRSFGDAGFVSFLRYGPPVAAQAPDGSLYLTRGFDPIEDGGPLRMLPNGTLDEELDVEPRVRGHDIAVAPSGTIYMVVGDYSARYIYAYVVGERRIPTHLALTVDGPGESRQSMHAALTEAATGEPIVGATIAFVADGHEIGSSETGPDGVAVIAVPPRHRQATTYAARYGGSQSHEPATALAP